VNVRGALGRVANAVRHPIGQNALALYVVQFAISILPLVTLPYLARVLGPHELGVVVFSQAFAWMLLLLIEFGFASSATRAVARRRDDPEALADAVASTQGAKLALSGMVFAAAAVALFAVPLFRDQPGYLVLALVSAIAQGLSPGWFFTGIERLRLVSALEVVNRVVATVLTIVLVRGEGDGWIVLALWVAGTIIVTASTTVLMYRRVHLRRPTLAGVRWALSQSWKLFIGGTAVSLYTSANVFLLGILSTTVQAAYFSAAEKLVRAAPRVFGPVATAVFPRVGNLVARGEEARAARLTRLTILVLVSLSSSVALVFVAFAGPIVGLLYGDEFEASVAVLRVLALTLPIIGLSTGLGHLVLLTHHMDREAVTAVIAAGVTNVILALLVAPAHGALGMAWVLVAVEGVAVAGNLFFAIRRRDQRARTAVSAGK
jgi:PST family polysaccharide transporter